MRTEFIDTDLVEALGWDVRNASEEEYQSDAQV